MTRPQVSKVNLIPCTAEETFRSAGNTGVLHYTSMLCWDGTQGSSYPVQMPTSELYTSSLERLSSCCVSAPPSIPQISIFTVCDYPQSPAKRHLIPSTSSLLPMKLTSLDSLKSLLSVLAHSE